MTLEKLLSIGTEGPPTALARPHALDSIICEFGLKHPTDAPNLDFVI